MKAVIQKVSQASVTVEGHCCGKIEKGFLLLLGVHAEDTKEDADYLVRKIANLRIFEDEQNKLNLSLRQVNGSILSISQFTLYADTQKGNRPSCVKAATQEVARPLYDYVNECLRKEGLCVQTGKFGCEMQISLVNEGPVTIVIDTRKGI